MNGRGRGPAAFCRVSRLASGAHAGLGGMGGASPATEKKKKKGKKIPHRREEKDTSGYLANIRADSTRPGTLYVPQGEAAGTEKKKGGNAARTGGGNGVTLPTFTDQTSAHYTLNAMCQRRGSRRKREKRKRKTL